MLTPISTAPSRRNASFVVASGKMTAARPSMSRMLAMLLPTTLPIAIPGAPIWAALRLATSSGVEVPKPTRVKPMSSGETPSRLAAATLPFTRASPPPSSSTRPMMSWTDVICCASWMVVHRLDGGGRDQRCVP
jgi:hypothetical protein